MNSTAPRLALLGLLLIAAGVAAESIEDRNWLEVRSENFRIFSVLNEERNIELLRHLEIMRASLGDAMEESTWQSGVPTTIIAFDKHDDYASVGAPANSAGFFFSDLRENAIVIDDSDTASGIQIILHEYAHYLNKQSGRIRYPRWYEEGNAEYLSNSKIREQAFEYGIASPHHVAALYFERWLSLSTVLETSAMTELEELEGALFYAQSWLLVHYLRSTHATEKGMHGRLSTYSNAVASGQSPVEAFERAFAVKVSDLEQQLLQYHKDKQFETRIVPTDTALPGFNTVVREMSQAEAQLALARMALRFQNFDNAEQWFRQVLTDNDLRAHAEAGLGRVLGYRGEIEAANERFDAAIHLMAWDFVIWMDYARYFAERVATASNYEERAEFALRLINALNSALTIEDATPEVNSLMGYAYLARGDINDLSKAIEYLEDATEAAPHDQGSRLLLANAYFMDGRFKRATEVAESVLRFEHQPNEMSDAAGRILRQIRERRLR